MRNLLKKLWDDDGGFIVSFELMLVFVILLLGIIAGLTALRNAVVAELVETGQAVLALQQGFTINGTSSCGGSSQASGAVDVAGTITFSQTTATGTISQTACP